MVYTANLKIKDGYCNSILYANTLVFRRSGTKSTMTVTQYARAGQKFGMNAFTFQPLPPDGFEIAFRTFLTTAN